MHKEKTHFVLKKFPLFRITCNDCPQVGRLYITLDVPDAVAAVILQHNLHTVHPDVQVCVKPISGGLNTSHSGGMEGGVQFCTFLLTFEPLVIQS